MTPFSRLTRPSQQLCICLNSSKAANMNLTFSTPVLALLAIPHATLAAPLVSKASTVQSTATDPTSFGLTKEQSAALFRTLPNDYLLEKMNSEEQSEYLRLDRAAAKFHEDMVAQYGYYRWPNSDTLAECVELKAGEPSRHGNLYCLTKDEESVARKVLDELTTYESESLKQHGISNLDVVSCAVADRPVERWLIFNSSVPLQWLPGVARERALF